MRKLITIVLSLVLILPASSQNFQDEAYTYLHKNQISALFNAGGLSFHSDTAGAQFLFPGNSNKSLINSMGLWIGGLDLDGELHVAAMTYNDTARDFFPGPVMHQQQYAAQYNTWNRLWKLNQTEIDDCMLQYNQPGYNFPDAIENWPAHGNVTLGQAQNLAPFIDVDNDGMYKCIMGDYPYIRGDQAVYFIFNDSVGVHSQSGGLPLGVEVHAMAYEVITDPLLQNVVFMNYLIINRTNVQYDSLFIGCYTDTDLGDPLDDYIGCDSAENMFFSYNGRDPDDVYGQSPPVIGVKFLNQTMSGFLLFSDGGLPRYNTPTNANGFYLNLNSLCQDSIPQFLYPGGHPNAGTDTIFTNYMFNGNPFDTSNYFNEMEFGNAPYERYELANTGPYKLAAGGYISLDIALIVADSISQLKSMQGNMNLLYSLQQYVQDYFNQHYPSDGSDLILGMEENKETGNDHRLKIYPNPVSNELSIELEGNFRSIQLSIYDLSGRLLLSETNSTNKVSIDVSRLMSGLYFLQAQADGISIIRKFVKK